MRPMIDVTITECPRTSFTAALMVLNLNGMRLFAATLSSIRKDIQIVLIATKRIKRPKIACQAKASITNEPINGAKAGTVEKMIMTKEEMRAISRP